MEGVGGTCPPFLPKVARRGVSVSFFLFWELSRGALEAHLLQAAIPLSPLKPTLKGGTYPSRLTRVRLHSPLSVAMSANLLQPSEGRL